MADANAPPLSRTPYEALIGAIYLDSDYVTVRRHRPHGSA